MQMQFEFGIVPLGQVRFLDTPQPAKRRIAGYIEPELYNEIAVIAQEENIQLVEVVAQLLELAVRHYKLKKNEVQPKETVSEKTFYCQVCGKTCKTRYMHKATVFNEEYKFCEDCYFADKHKKFV